jgi:uncharacterized membrane protein
MRVKKRGYLFRDAHHRFLWSLFVAGISFVILKSFQAFATALVGAWDLSALFHIGFAWIIISRLDPAEVHHDATLQDGSRSLILAFILLASAASLLSVGFVLGPVKEMQAQERLLHIALSVVAIISSWLLVHTTFTLHYAHVYFRENLLSADKGQPPALDFPGNPAPDYLDFAYFSFVIGMTCQTSDVGVRSRRIRRLSLLHGLLSFAFNTIILALTINVIAGLL